MWCVNLFVFALAMLLHVGTGAAATDQGQRVVSSLLELRQSDLVLQQWDLSCGAAALATILTFNFDDPVSERDIAEAMLQDGDPLRVQARGGFSMLDLQRFVEGRGYTGVGYGNLSIEDLVDFGPTVVVPVRLQSYDHFVVFRGVSNGRVLIADPAFGNRSLSYRQFRRAWRGNVGLVVSRGDD